MSDMNIKSSSIPAGSIGLLALGLQQPSSQTPKTPANVPVQTDTVTAVGNASKPANQSLGPLEKAAAQIQKYMPRILPDTQLRITHDKSSGLYVYEAVNPKTGDVVSQYPSEEILKFIAYFRQKEGIAVDQSA